MEPKPIFDEPNMIVIKELFNAFTSSKVNSRLAAYNQATTMQTKKKMSIGSQLYSLTEKKDKKDKVPLDYSKLQDNVMISPVKLSRFTLKDIPTQSIVKHMEQRKITESRSQDLSAVCANC